MTLEGKLKEIFEKKKGFILVVDDRCDVITGSFDNSDYRDHIHNEEDCEIFASDKGVALTLWDTCHEEIQEKPDNMAGERRQHASSIQRFLKHLNGDPALILVAANINGNRCADLTRSSASVAKIKEMAPQADVVYFLPEYDNSAMNACIRQVLPIFVHPKAREVAERVNIRRFPTLMHLLAEKMTGKHVGGGESTLRSDQHRYKNDMWKDNYLPYIGKSLRAGNLQSITDYHFLILSDREISLLGQERDYVYSEEKVKVRKASYELDDKDLGKCAAIFIDNAWNDLIHSRALGDGIETLKRVRKQLDEKGINIPIIYQSGHRLEDFAAEERAEIEGLGAVLAAKDIFPKICIAEEISEKEIEAGRLLQKNPKLAKYVVQTRDFGKKHPLGRGNLFVVCSRIVEDGKIEDLEKDALFAKLGIEDNVYNHRMYVLSMIHAELKDQVGNEKFRPNVPQFMDYNNLRDAFGDRIDKYRQLYERIANDPEHNEKRTISHNDAKEDNWFQGRVLGDFSNAAPGTEYKDIARALLDQEDGFKLAMDPERVRAHVDNYIALEKESDRDFDLNADDFRKRVFETMFTEALRLAYFKKARNEGEDKVKAYLAVADKYFNLLN